MESKRKQQAKKTQWRIEFEQQLAAIDAQAGQSKREQAAWAKEQNRGRGGFARSLTEAFGLFGTALNGVGYLIEKRRIYFTYCLPLSREYPEEFRQACTTVGGLYEEWRRQVEQEREIEKLVAPKLLPHTPETDEALQERLKKQLSAIEREFSDQPELMADLKERCISKFMEGEK